MVTFTASTPDYMIGGKLIEPNSNILVKSVSKYEELHGNVHIQSTEQYGVS